jgi:hypothetical protein
MAAGVLPGVNYRRFAVVSGPPDVVDAVLGNQRHRESMVCGVDA